MKARVLFSTFLSAALTGFGQTTNCAGATQVCNDVAINGNSSGAGVQELTTANRGCLTVEHQSSWFYFQPATSGTVALTIETTVDYDFAIWATGNCASLGAPVRCSYSATTGNTGLAATYYGQTAALGCGTLGLSPCYGNIPVTDVSEGTTGDRWVTPLNVTAGQIYIMLIDNFTANSTPFTLSWTFSNGATLNCSTVHLPVELVEFAATYNPSNNSNKIYWQTETERLNDHFTLERSTEGTGWNTIDQQPGAENSVAPRIYTYEDFSYEPGKVNYYRLSQTDYDGTVRVFKAISVNNGITERRIIKVFNTMGQEVPRETTGIVILQYEDGTTRRVYR